MVSLSSMTALAVRFNANLSNVFVLHHIVVDDKRYFVSPLEDPILSFTGTQMHFQLSEVVMTITRAELLAGVYDNWMIVTNNDDQVLLGAFNVRKEAVEKFISHKSLKTMSQVIKNET